MTEWPNPNKDWEDDKLIMENLYGFKGRKTSAKKLIHNYIEKNCK